MFKRIGDFIERLIRQIVILITNFLPVKVIRDDRGVPFLYRYHLFALGKDGPGMCIHHFVASDPDRGYHDHPWNYGLSFILCGGYKERILKRETNDYTTIERNRWRFNFLRGRNVFHRVMLEPHQDAWTIFAFQKRSKTWGMVSLAGEYKPMSTTIHDQDGGWWNHVIRGLGIHHHLKLQGEIFATVDIVVIANNSVLLIKRGKEPFKGYWAFPGGRIDPGDEDILTAAKRELYEETHIKDDGRIRYVKTIGNKQRDPRGFCITNVFVMKFDSIPDTVKAGDDAVDFVWADLTDLPLLAFDHQQILTEILQ